MRKLNRAIILGLAGMCGLGLAGVFSQLEVEASAQEAERALAIIDMQPAYWDGKRFKVYPQIQPNPIESVIANIHHEIQTAMSNHQPIIFVKMKALGEIEPTLLDAVEGYGHVQIVEKTEEDGSVQVYQALRDTGCNKVKVCGLYTAYCVLGTVQGLRRIQDIQSITLNPAACSDTSQVDHEWAIDQMKRIGVVIDRLIESPGA